MCPSKPHDFPSPFIEAARADFMGESGGIFEGCRRTVYLPVRAVMKFVDNIAANIDIGALTSLGSSSKHLRAGSSYPVSDRPSPLRSRCDGLRVCDTLRQGPYQLHNRLPIGSCTKTRPHFTLIAQ